MIVDGAKTVAMTEGYVRFLESVPRYTQDTSLRGKVGAALFLSTWAPVMRFIEVVVKATVDVERGGVVPGWVKTFVRFLVGWMWICHEVHALFWGRGDGLDEDGDLGGVDLRHRTHNLLGARHMPWSG